MRFTTKAPTFLCAVQAVTKTFSPCATWKLNLLSLLSCLYFSLGHEFLRSVFNGICNDKPFFRMFCVCVCLCAGICLFTSRDMCIEHGEASVLWASHCVESSRRQRFLSLPVFHVPELVFCLREKLVFKDFSISCLSHSLSLSYIYVLTSALANSLSYVYVYFVEFSMDMWIRSWKYLVKTRSIILYTNLCLHALYPRFISFTDTVKLFVAIFPAIFGLYVCRNGRENYRCNKRGII